MTGCHWRRRGGRCRGGHGVCAAHAGRRTRKGPRCWTLDRICHGQRALQQAGDGDER